MQNPFGCATSVSERARTPVPMLFGSIYVCWPQQQNRESLGCITDSQRRAAHLLVCRAHSIPGEQVLFEVHPRKMCERVKKKTTCTLENSSPTI